MKLCSLGSPKSAGTKRNRRRVPVHGRIDSAEHLHWHSSLHGPSSSIEGCKRGPSCAGEPDMSFFRRKTAKQQVKDSQKGLAADIRELDREIAASCMARLYLVDGDLVISRSLSAEIASSTFAGSQEGRGHSYSRHKSRCKRWQRRQHQNSGPAVS